MLSVKLERYVLSHLNLVTLLPMKIEYNNHCIHFGFARTIKLIRLKRKIDQLLLRLLKFQRNLISCGEVDTRLNPRFVCTNSVHENLIFAFITLGAFEI